MPDIIKLCTIGTTLGRAIRHEAAYADANDQKPTLTENEEKNG